MIELFLVGRLLAGAYFLYNAYNHFRNYKGLSAYAASKGVPAPQVAVLGSGVLLLLGGLSLIVGRFPIIGMWLLIIFLVPVSIMMHSFWKEADPAAKAGERVNFLKNMALVGLLLMLIGAFSM